MSMGDDVDLGLKAILAGPRDVHNDHITHTHIHTVKEITAERVSERAIP